MDILKWAESGLHGVLEKLSLSPFKEYRSLFSEFPYLEYINYFIPVDTIIAITSAWVTAIGVYYLYSIALRWIKAIS